MKARALLALPLDQAVRRLALAQLDAAATAYTRITDRDDAEALHDFRVALRRLRSLLRAYAPWYDPVPKNLQASAQAGACHPRSTRRRGPIEWLRRTLPRLKVGARFGLAWLLARLAKRQHTAHRAVRKVVRKEFAAIEPRLRAALHARKHGRDAVACEGVTFAQVTDERLSSYCAELAADLAGIGSVADRDEIHAARISGKRLRYLLEPLRGSVPGAAVQVNTMKAFQTASGI
jgi:CHAD domain-containing protein